MRETPDTAAGLRILDLARLQTLGDETGLGVRGVAALFLDQMDHQLGDLRAAIRDRSADHVARMAHKCAGSSVLAGMERLSRLLHDLEHSPDEGLGDAERLTSLEREFEAVIARLTALVAAPDDEGGRADA